MAVNHKLYETVNGVSYGANTIRDGVSLNAYEKRHLLVLPTEISTLPNLECYVKYPGNWPITKLKMKLEKPKSITESFLLKEVKTPIQYVRKENEKLFEQKDFEQKDLFKKEDKNKHPSKDQKDAFFL